jgi:hypothetical protein
MNTTATVQNSPRVTQSHRRFWLRWLVGGVGVLLFVAISLFGYMLWRMSHVPANLDTATTRLSAEGTFRGTYVAKLNPIAINQIHPWVFHLETANGQPITGAQITVDGGMPQHGHGLPTSPQVTQDLGNGDYRVEGLKFHMPGWWVVNFHIAANGKNDQVTFNLILQ